MATAAQMAAMMNPNASYPLKDIPSPHDHDVLCGRGGGTNNHIGNSHWRMLVAANKQLYITLPKRQKMLLSRSIVNAVRSQNPPGRFLQKDSKTKLWFDVGDQKAQEKTSQALREGAPDIRKKVATEAVLSSSSSPVVAPATTPATTTTSSAVASASGTILPPGRMPPPPPQQPQPPPQQQQQHYSPQQPQSMYGAPSGHMTLDERGMMVRQNMMMGNTTNNNNYQQQQQQQQGYRHQQYEPYQQQQQYASQQQQQQQYYNGNNNNNSMPAPPPAPPPPPPTFDEVIAAPPEELETQGLSFGSIAMTDAEMQRLQQATAAGTHNKPMGRHHSLSRDYTAAAPMNALEPTGISIGDVSMMSAATNLTNLQMKLDEGGTSFGTMMSFTTNSGYNNNNINADMVDGGLMDAVGTSFGSLSLDRNNRDKLFQTLELAAGGPEVPPMFRSEIKSSGNLLDCSDTESESSREKELLVQEKSQAWERMKTQLEKQTSKSVASSVGSQELMPPPPAPPQSQNRAAVAEFDNIEIALPTMEANFSTLSAWSAADDGDDNDQKKNPPGDNNDDDDDDDAAAPPPPPQLTKTTDSF